MAIMKDRSAERRPWGVPGGSGQVIARGAEAEIVTATWLGRPVLEKRRVPKRYRHPELDARLRAERTRDEASLLIHARRAGVPVPVVLDVDLGASVLRLEHVHGAALRDVLPEDDEATACARLRALGGLTARLHVAGLTHGDLTTSNVLVPDRADAASLVVIDLGLGRATEEDEPRGVDLHLVEEALEATDDRNAALFAAFLAGHEAACAELGRPDVAAGALERLERIRERGRYRGHG